MKTKRIQQWLLHQKNCQNLCYSNSKALFLDIETRDSLAIYSQAIRLNRCFWENIPSPIFLEKCLKASEIFPKSFAIAALLARAYLYNGDAERAAEILRRIPKVSSKRMPEWLVYLAKAEHFLGNSEKAIDIYKQAATEWPASLPKLFRELVTYEPESSEVSSFADKIIETLHDESIYSVLFYNRTWCFENGHAELTRQRLSLMVDKFDKHPMPQIHPEKNYAFVALEQIWLYDQNIIDHVLRKKLVSFFMDSCKASTSYSATSFDFKEKSRLKVGFSCISPLRLDWFTSFYIFCENFDTSKFELILFLAESQAQGECYEKISSLFSKVITYKAQNWQEYKRLLLDEKLDIYMAENTYSPDHMMAFFSRFAPVQINAWDRVNSFGAPHTDYLLAFGDKNKLPEWSTFVKEKYAVLDQHYAPPSPSRAKPVKVDYAALNLPDGPFFFYPQALCRLLPHEDHIFATLLRNNPDHYFLGLTYTTPDKLITYRWKKNMPDCADRMITLPNPIPLPIYLGLIKEASVLLTSLEASHGGLSSSTILSLGCPLVTGYGTCWNSCITQFQYTKMGVEGLVASSHEEYIAIAQRLIDEPDWKKQKSKDIKENFHKIYNIPCASQETQEFLLQAYERARLGLKPEHWGDGHFIETIK